jgi:hypothetical protein
METEADMSRREDARNPNLKTIVAFMARLLVSAARCFFLWTPNIGTQGMPFQCSQLICAFTGTDGQQHVQAITGRFMVSIMAKKGCPGCCSVR